MPRYTGKTDLALDDTALIEADRVRAGWNPAHWSVDQAARTLLVLSLPTDNLSAYLGRLEKVFNAASLRGGRLRLRHAGSRGPSEPDPGNAGVGIGRAETGG